QPDSWIRKTGPSFGPPLCPQSGPRSRRQAAEGSADAVGEAGGEGADGEGFEAGDPPSLLDEAALEGADGEEGDGRHGGAGAEGVGHRGCRGEAEDEWDERDGADEVEGGEGGGGGGEGVAPGGSDAVLFGEHGFDPAFAVAGDDLDDLFEDVAIEALGLEDLADFLALAFRVGVDFDF